jgi:hypothetical protein
MLQPGAMQRARMFLAVLWAGGAVLVAIAASVLNRVMTDRVAFGETVSGLFRQEARLGLVCGLLLLGLIWFDQRLDARKRRTLLIVTVVMLTCILGYFVVQPMMAALREGAGAGGVMASSARKQFGMLHGVSMLLYLVQTVLAVVLVFKSRK